MCLASDLSLSKLRQSLWDFRLSWVCNFVDGKQLLDVLQEQPCTPVLCLLLCCAGGLAQLGQGSRGQGRVLQQPHGAPVSTLSLISQQAGLVA